nr:hypothetical protein [uncultured Mediterraneibacter sp.]
MIPHKKVFIPDIRYNYWGKRKIPSFLRAMGFCVCFSYVTSQSAIQSYLLICFLLAA